MKHKLSLQNIIWAISLLVVLAMIVIPGFRNSSTQSLDESLVTTESNSNDGLAEIFTGITADTNGNEISKPAPSLTPSPSPSPSPEPTPTPSLTPTPTSTPTPKPLSEADYDKYSNEKVAWSFKRNKEHIPSGTYEPFDISKYNAYFLNTDAASKGEKVIYLAFDCGYEEGYTSLILDTLKAHNAKAVFFLTKDFLDSDSELAGRMKEEGHIVGNHTLHHPSLPSCSFEKLLSEVNGLAEYYKEKTGYELDKFIRPPMGEYSERTLKILEDLGYTTIFWSLAYYDYDTDNQPGKDHVVNHFNDYYHDGMISLIHTISSSNAEALDDVLTLLEAAGYRFGTIDELTTAKHE